METFKKVLSVGLLVLLSIVTAMIAGAGLAIWDTGEKISTVYAMAFDGANNEPVIKDTQTIVMQDVKLSDVTDTTPSVKQKATESNISLPEQFVPIEDAEDAALEEDSTDAETEEVDITEKDEESSEEENTIVITSEISGISNIVNALDGEILQAKSQPQIQIQTVYPGGNNADNQLAPVNPDFPNPVTDFPREFTEVDLSYFDDALFIGDSRMQGLGMYSKTNATFYAATAFQLFQYITFKVVPTANGKIPIFDAMQYDQFTKVYIKVGLNELGCVSDEKFLDDYQSFIDRIRAMQPRAIIYIHAVLPVTASKSQTDKTHCNEKIKARNESLKAFAQMNNCYFVDVSEEFTDESGALRAELTSDGIHMAGRYMADWIDALRRRAVKWP